MGTVVVRRPQRQPAPEMPSGGRAQPPQVPVRTGRAWTQVLIVLPLVALLAGIVLVSSGGASVLRFVVFGLFGLAMLAVLVMAYLGGATGTRHLGNARMRYLRELAAHRERLARSTDGRRNTLCYLHPEPTALWAVAAGHRLWERRRGDTDFGTARVGLGRHDLAGPIAAPPEVGDLPVALPVDGFARIHVDGDRARGVGLVRAVLAQLTVLHSPEDLRVAVCAGPRTTRFWDWVKWLPHALHPDRSDALGPVRLVAPTLADLDGLADGRPHLVVVLDGGSFTPADRLLGGLPGVTVLDLTTVPPRSPDPGTLVLDVAPDGALLAVAADGVTTLGTADTLSEVHAEALARALAPLRPHGDPSPQRDLAALLGLGDPRTFDPATTWVRRPARDQLRVPFGVAPDGAPVSLDLKDPAHGGMGPHGFVVGTAGTGELLRTVVLALAVTHPPNMLNIALLDAGTGTFTGLHRLPHIAAAPAAPAATADALRAELTRRRDLLTAAGPFHSLADYDAARAAGTPLAEIPVLLVVCAGYTDVCATLVETGGPLGVHLLLAAPHPVDGFSCRITLDPDGRLEVGDRPPVRFRAAVVSGAPAAVPSASPGVRPYTTAYVAPAAEPAPTEPVLDILAARLTDRGTPARPLLPAPPPVPLGAAAPPAPVPSAPVPSASVPSASASFGPVTRASGSNGAVVSGSKPSVPAPVPASPVSAPVVPAPVVPAPVVPNAVGPALPAPEPSGRMPVAPTVRRLPARVETAALPARDEPGRFAVGIGERDQQPVHVDFTANPHLVVLGDSGSGKTGFLRLLAGRITAATTPEQARLVIVDPGGGLHDVAGGQHLIGYGPDPASTVRLMADAARALAPRLPGSDSSDGTDGTGGTRPPWTGPDLYVLVDDSDVAGTACAPLFDLLGHGAEIGLHVVLTRRAAGAVADPILANVGDAGLLLSGSPEDGPLLGGRTPTPLPAGRGRLVTADGAVLVQLAQ